MLLRLPDPAARFAVLVLALVLAVTLSFFSVRNARAAIEAGLGTRAGYEAAARLEPTNPENWYLLGRYWQYTLDDPDPTRAIVNFRHALSLNPRYADAWLDLGAVSESEGDLSGARDAYVQARNAYPESAAPFTPTRSAAPTPFRAAGVSIPTLNPFSATLFRPIAPLISTSFASSPPLINLPQRSSSGSAWFLFIRA